ncbi:hypothetical protein ACF0H5_004644 [Mactra antiquata]
MGESNLSVVLHKVNDIRLENTAIREPGKGEVQLRMARVGICGTDIHFWKHGFIGNLKVASPFTLGHETSGIVSKLGEDVTTLKVGDRVALEPVMTCGRCDKCKIGRYNLCPKMAIFGIPPCDGGLAQYHLHDANLCYKLPDSVSLEEGALMEPLSVTIHAARRAGITLGSRVLICGSGTIGLLSLLVAKSYGASQVCVMDLNESRLKLAKSMGADVTLVPTTKDARGLADEIEQCMNGKPTISLECSGAPLCVQSSIYATDSGGCVLCIGLGPDDVTIPFVDAVLREVDVKAINTYPNCYPIALALLQSGTVDVKQIITHEFKLEQSLEAFELVGRGEGIKVMINCE